MTEGPTLAPSNISPGGQLHEDHLSLNHLFQKLATQGKGVADGARSNAFGEWERPPGGREGAGIEVVRFAKNKVGIHVVELEAMRVITTATKPALKKGAATSGAATSQSISGNSKKGP